MASFRENLMTRRANIATELAAVRNTDTNEYVLRLWEELRRLDLLLQSPMVEASANESFGPFEEASRGIT